MKSIVVIPARGGSRRLPQKNLLPWGPHPLVGHAILTAKRAGATKIVVSTDNRRIGFVASQYGADVHIRWTVPDDQPSEVPYIAVLEQNRLADVAVLMQCTSPTLRPSELRHGIDTAAGGNTAFAARRIETAMETKFTQTGAFYACPTWRVLQYGSRWGTHWKHDGWTHPNTAEPIVMAMPSDIDTAIDYTDACEEAGLPLGIEARFATPPNEESDADRILREHEEKDL